MNGSQKVFKAAYEFEACVHERFTDEPVLVANLHQNPKSHRCLMPHMPTLMTATSSIDPLKSTGKLPRFLIPLEHLAVMGHPVFEGGKSLLSEVLPTLRGAEMKHLAGNGFIVSRVGTVLIWFLACTSPMKVGDEKPKKG